MNYENCTLCPRMCGVDRTKKQLGYCKGGDRAVVSKWMIHHWEEPALAGSGGSGAIFFGGCTLGCRYCQNAAISRTPHGEAVDGQQLRQIMEALIAQGAENIDLVTPTHYLPTILQALQTPLGVPVVYNCGGYERTETLEQLRGKVDIFLPDLKYGPGDLGKTQSCAADYFEVATKAILKMAELTGKISYQGEKLVKGVVIRHLILPGQVENSLRVLDWIGEHFDPGQVLVSLMAQYTPMPGMSAPYDRKITREEYDSVLSWMYLNGLQGFTQSPEAADSIYIPEF